MFISFIPAALPFTRVLIASSSSCKVNSSDSKDLCSSVLYLEYGISIFDYFFITCVLPFLLSTWATWFAVTCSYFVLGVWFGWVIGDFANVMPCLSTVLG